MRWCDRERERETVGSNAFSFAQGKIARLAAWGRGTLIPCRHADLRNILAHTTPLSEAKGWTRGCV